MINSKVYKSISAAQIDELTAIYDDYVYMARQHEAILTEKYAIEGLAAEQMEIMYPSGPDFPWRIDLLSRTEKQEFADFVKNDIICDDTKTYVLLKYIKPQENAGFDKEFAVSPYKKGRYHNDVAVNVGKLPNYIPTKWHIGKH